MSTINCLRCGQQGSSIEESPPYPGEIGKRIAEHICQACWNAWKKFSVNVINDYKLRPFLPQDRAVVEKHMKQYLNLELQPLGTQPAGITLTGQGMPVTFDEKGSKEITPSGGGLKEKVYDMLEQIFDPEIPVNIRDLGLIYDVDVSGDTVAIKMTLTSRACPAAQSLPATVKESVSRIPGVKETKVDVVWDPPWSKDLITDEGKQILGM
jgi:metal-sulfur cluster biosynthetic enzyme/Fe-S cluster biosynthesis and repair protein YggX